MAAVLAREADKAEALLRTHIGRTEQLVAAALHGAGSRTQ